MKNNRINLIMTTIAVYCAIAGVYYLEANVLGASGQAWAPQSPASMEMPDIVENPYPDAYGSAVDSHGALSGEKMSWYFVRNANTHQPPAAQKDFDIRLFNACYLGDINCREIYLTFDEGYENGNTERILDILKEKDVPAAFFVTAGYIRRNPELVIRMVEEGHVVGNHTVNHKSSPSLTEAELTEELEGTAEAFVEVTGLRMPGFFRPPMGEYSARTLDAVNKAGYRTVFWSFAHEDWYVDKQPGTGRTFERITSNLHNGEIMLLHAVSGSNLEAMPSVIDAARAQDFEFKSLYDLPENPEETRSVF